MMTTDGFTAALTGAHTTEPALRRRYNDLAPDPQNMSRRRNMTMVTIRGGADGSSPGRDDLIIIRAWNNEAVCREKVIGFDTPTHP